MKYLIVLFFLTSNLSFASTLNSNTGKGFKKNTIKIRIAGTDCSGAGFSTSKFRNMVKNAAVVFWNSVPSSALKLSVGNVDNSLDIDGLSHTNALNTVVADNQIVAGCNDDATDFSDPDILGSALMDCNGSNCRAILILNANNSTLNDMSTGDIEATIAHEIGHAVGLGHSKYKHNLMYWNIGGKSQKWLGQDDINGITYLYPHESEMSCLLGSMGGTTKHTDNKDSGTFVSQLILGFFLGLIIFVFLGIIYRQLFAIKLN